MSTATSLEIFCSYPHTSPWDEDLQPNNAVPAVPHDDALRALYERVKSSDPTESILHSSLRISLMGSQFGFPRCNSNLPLYGACPLDYPQDVELPEWNALDDYSSPPPICQVVNPGTIRLVDVLNTEEYLKIRGVIVLRVMVGEEYRILRLYPKQRGFESERLAYAHLQHFGACAAGAVPKCYGWTELALREIGQTENLKSRVLVFLNKKLSAMILEDLGQDVVPFDDKYGTEVSHRDGTTLLADVDKVLRALHKVHLCYVFPKKCSLSHFVRCSDGRWVLLGLNRAVCPLVPAGGSTAEQAPADEDEEKWFTRQGAMCNLRDRWQDVYFAMLPTFHLQDFARAAHPGLTKDGDGFWFPALVARMVGERNVDVMHDK